MSHKCKLFVLGLVTWNSNCLLTIIISNLKLYKCENKWLLSDRNTFFEPYVLLLESHT